MEQSDGKKTKGLCEHISFEKINRWSQRNQSINIFRSLWTLSHPSHQKLHTTWTVPPYTESEVHFSLFWFHWHVPTAAARWECQVARTECWCSVTEHLFHTADRLSLACITVSECWRGWTGNWHRSVSFGFSCSHALRHTTLFKGVKVFILWFRRAS